jgi:hypothetical protein
LLAGIIAPGGLLVIVDMVPDADRSGPAYPLMFALTMLLNTEAGGTYTADEYRGWLTGVGFDLLEPVRVPAHHSPILLARRKV